MCISQHITRVLTFPALRPSSSFLGHFNAAYDRLFPPTNICTFAAVALALCSKRRRLFLFLYNPLSILVRSPRNGLPKSYFLAHTTITTTPPAITQTSLPEHTLGIFLRSNDTSSEFSRLRNPFRRCFQCGRHLSFAIDTELDFIDTLRHLRSIVVQRAKHLCSTYTVGDRRGDAVATRKHG